MSHANVLAAVDANGDKGKVLKRPVKKILMGSNENETISRWFVSNQKTSEWGEKQLNQLHIAILLLLVIIYVCHVVASPFLQFIHDQTVIIVIKIIEILCLIVAIACLVKACYVNGSWTAVKLIFDKRNVRIYVYGFWIVRSFIIEILKGQIIYSFVHVFHTVLIYSTDTWYLCNQNTLIINLLLLLSILTFEFFISISPVAPAKPEWTFINMKITANSLSRSNLFNLFVIFFDALIIVIYDAQRSKYVMLAKKQKRDAVTISFERKQKLIRLWKGTACFTFTGFSIFILESSSSLPSQVSPLFYTVSVASVSGIGFLLYADVVYHSSTRAGEILCKLLRERRVIFILILLGIFLYVDIVAHGVSADGIVFPLLICGFISMDIISSYFPRKLSMILMVFITLMLLWDIFNYTFLKKDCEEKKLNWGIFGEKISYCTIKRLIFQSILSLLASGAIATFTGRVDNLFFCNINVHRSTGTIDRTSINQNYVRSMSIEQRNSEIQDETLQQEREVQQETNVVVSV